MNILQNTTTTQQITKKERKEFVREIKILKRK